MRPHHYKHGLDTLDPAVVAGVILEVEEYLAVMTEACRVISRKDGSLGHFVGWDDTLQMVDIMWDSGIRESCTYSEWAWLDAPEEGSLDDYC